MHDDKPRSLLEYFEWITQARMNKQQFGEMVHSSDEAEVQEALSALAESGGYENLPD